MVERLFLAVPQGCLRFVIVVFPDHTYSLFCTTEEVQANESFLLIVPRRCFFCGSFLLFLFRVCLCHTVVSVPCSLVVTCGERADLLALACVMFSCVFVTFSYGALGQVWFLIVPIPDICLLPYFTNITR